MGGCTFIAGWSNFDSEVRLRKAIVAKSNSNEAVLDTMVKIIKQKVQIATVGQEQMQAIYHDILAGRQGGALFKMVQEQYPDPDKAMTLWKDLMNSVEAERKTFLRDQKAIQDLVAERESLINGFMSRKLISLFGGDTIPMKRKGHPESLGTPSEYQYVFVTSTATEIMVEKGREDDIDLGLKKGTIK
jgi:hypothetical protein